MTLLCWVCIVRHMPTNINPIVAPEVPDPKQKSDDEPKALPLRGLEPPKEIKPDVSAWVRKANARLAPPWAENEFRCGRLFEMPGATIFEAREVAAIYKTFDTVVSTEKRGVMVTFKPRRGKTQLPKP